MKTISKLLCLAFFAVVGLQAGAQNITVEELLRNYYEAVGGPEQWKNLNSMKFIGSGENMGMNFPVVVYSMRPNLQKVEVDIQGKKFVDAFDGETAWTINPFMGGLEPQKKTEEETKEAAKQMFEDELVNYAEKGHSVSLEGTEEVEGVQAIKLKLTKKDGDEVYYFFDPEAYVPIMQRQYIKFGPMKGQPVETYFSDYDEVEGMYFPFSIVQKVNGQVVMNMRADSIELNPPLDKSIFAFPKPAQSDGQ